MGIICGINGRLGSGKDLTASIIQYLVKLNVSDDFKDSSFEYFNKLSSEQKFFYSGFQVRKFAAKLKQIVALLTGCTVEDLESQEFKASQLGPEWDYVEHYLLDGKKLNRSTNFFKNDDVFKANPERFIKHYTYRDLLQKIGTEAMRDSIHEQIWVNAAFADYQKIPNCANYVTGNGCSNCLPDGNCSEIYPNYIFTDMRFPNEMEAIKQRGGITIRINRFPKDPNKQEHISETALDNASFDYEIYNTGSVVELIETVKLVLIKAEIINATI